MKTLWRSHSTLGIFLAATFFAASLTPSLMPRDPILQGLVSGLVAIIGYELGRLIMRVWRFTELPELSPEKQSLPRVLIAVVSLAIIAFALWKAADWQNITRTLMGMDPIETSAPMTTGAIALGVFLAVWLLLRAFGWFFRLVNRVAGRFVPRRIGIVISFAFAVWVFWALIDGTLVRTALDIADASYAAADALIEPEIDQPTDPLKTGSSVSVVDWYTLGRWGRSFIATGPTATEIAAFQSAEVKEPIRVYVGRGSATTAQERADLALEELRRVGGFDRSALVVMVPVGSGWMDPGGQDTLEFILGGDVATVAVQYSYLTSFLSLLTNPEYGTEQAKVLFNTIYDAWLELPESSRPKLYVHGLSQGAFNSQATLPFLDMLGDPISGALWAGSPFFSPFWSQIRDGRQEDSPAWRPVYGNGSLARSMNQYGGLNIARTDWGPIRLVFLNYGSYPIVNFTFDSAYRRPGMMREQRPPDVSPDLKWFPIVTMFQVALDMIISLKVPRFGHYYVAPDYIDGWAAVLDPPDWSDARAEDLKAIFEERGPAF